MRCHQWLTRVSSISSLCPLSSSSPSPSLPLLTITFSLPPHVHVDIPHRHFADRQALLRSTKAINSGSDGQARIEKNDNNVILPHRVLFFGSDAFAIPSLERIYQSCRHVEVVCPAMHKSNLICMRLPSAHHFALTNSFHSFPP